MSEIYNPELEKYAAKEVMLPPLEDVSQLIKDRGALKERAEKRDDMNSYEVLEEAPKRLAYARFDDVVDRISRETMLVQEIEDTVSKDNLLRNEGERRFPTEVAFGQEDIINPELSDKQDYKSHGSYSPKENKIRIAADEPNKKQLWFDLTYNGLPEVLKTLDHEIMHFWFGKGRQAGSKTRRLKRFFEDVEVGLYGRIYDEAKSASKRWDEAVGGHPRLERLPDVFHKVALAAGLRKFMRLRERYRKSKESRIIDEVVAQKAGRVFEKEENTTVSLLRALTESYGYNEPRDIDLIIASSQVVDRLRVLNFSDKEIATKLARAKYDRTTSSFPELEKEISTLAESRGAKVEDLDTRADVRRLRYETENLKARIIAQEELEKLGGELKKEKEVEGVKR